MTAWETVDTSYPYTELMEICPNRIVDDFQAYRDYGECWCERRKCGVLLYECRICVNEMQDAYWRIVAQVWEANFMEWRKVRFMKEARK